MAISQYGNEYYGLSGDDKPIGTPLNGRKFTEMDTSKEYRFDAENQQWLQQAGGGGGGSSTLSGLTDVDISNPTDGQTLVYNAESGKWENGAGGGGGGRVVSVNSVTQYTPETTDDPEMWEGTLDITEGELIAAFNSNNATPVFVHVPTFGHDTSFTYDTQENFCPMLHIPSPSIELSEPAMQQMMPPLEYLELSLARQNPDDPVHFYAAAQSIH